MKRVTQTRQFSIAADTARMLDELEQISKSVKLAETRSAPPARPASAPSMVIRGK